MDEASLPHFVNREGSGSSRGSSRGEERNCYSLDHPFHQQLYNYIKQQSSFLHPPSPIYKQGSVHVSIPETTAEEAEFAKTLESEFRKFEKGIPGFKINGEWWRRFFLSDLWNWESLT